MEDFSENEDGKWEQWQKVQMRMYCEVDAMSLCVTYVPHDQVTDVRHACREGTKKVHNECNQTDKGSVSANDNGVDL